MNLSEIANKNKSDKGIVWCEVHVYGEFMKNTYQEIKKYKFYNN